MSVVEVVDWVLLLVLVSEVVIEIGMSLVLVMESIWDEKGYFTSDQRWLIFERTWHHWCDQPKCHNDSKSNTNQKWADHATFDAWHPKSTTLLIAGFDWWKRKTLIQINDYFYVHLTKEFRHHRKSKFQTSSILTELIMTKEGMICFLIIFLFLDFIDEEKKRREKILLLDGIETTNIIRC